LQRETVHVLKAQDIAPEDRSSAENTNTENTFRASATTGCATFLGALLKYVHQVPTTKSTITIALT